jgi:hypothetical protein
LRKQDLANLQEILPREQLGNIMLCCNCRTVGLKCNVAEDSRLGWTHQMEAPFSALLPKTHRILQNRASQENHWQWNRSTRIQQRFTNYPRHHIFKFTTFLSLNSAINPQKTLKVKIWLTHDTHRQSMARDDSSWWCALRMRFKPSRSSGISSSPWSLQKSVKEDVGSYWWDMKNQKMQGPTHTLTSTHDVRCPGGVRSSHDVCRLQLQNLPFIPKPSAPELRAEARSDSTVAQQWTLYSCRNIPKQHQAIVATVFFFHCAWFRLHG